MTQTTARIKQHGKHFEIIVDLDRALKFKKGQSSAMDFLEADAIFTDSKRGLHASEKDIKEAFGTSDVDAVASKIVKSGEILLTEEHRDEEREKRIRQVITLFTSGTHVVNPQTGVPYTPERIRTALEEAHINIKSGPIESQIKDITNSLSKILPMKMEEKKFEITVPSIYTGQVYGLLNPYKVKETWLDNGDWRVDIAISGGMVLSIFDKLNSITHGAAITEEIKEKK